MPYPISDKEESVDMDPRETFHEAMEEGDEEALLHLVNGVLEPSMMEELVAEPAIFLKACQRGMTTLADVFISHGADVNASHEWEGQKWTPLELATVYGHDSTVELLLNRGAELSPLFEEDPASGIMYASSLSSSPFYLASIHGHPAIVDTLTSHNPRLIKQDSVCSILLAAACKGGNLDIVRKWYRPTININQPAQFVTSMDNCENLTALYSACEGGHQDVAEFLVHQLGAHLTKQVCQRFPLTVGAMLEQYFKQRQMGKGDSSSLDEEVEAHLSQMTLGAVVDTWLEPHLDALTLVDISHNAIDSLPDLLPWGLPNLRSFNAAHNRITSISPSPDGVSCERLIEVNLSYNRLTSVCVEVFQLPSILTLDLSHNRLALLGPVHRQHLIELSMAPSSGKLSADDVEGPSTQWRCSELTHLDVSHNELVMLPASLSACVSLTVLNASHNKLSGLPPPWNCPLGNLDLSYNELESVPASLDQFWTGSLVELHLDHNLLDQVRECLVRLCELKELTASHNHIEYLPSKECWECRHLTVLDLGHNILGESPTRSSMKRKGLQFPRPWSRGAGATVETSVVEFPEMLSACLQELNICNNHLTRVPVSVARLTSLQLLDLSNNPDLKLLPPELGLLVHCGQLSVTGCNISPVSVPPKLLSDGNKTYQIVTHLKSQLRQCQPCYRMKLIVMGPPERGKSTLISLLRGQRRTDVSAQRNFINVQEWILPVPPAEVASRRFSFIRGRQKLALSVWELSGKSETCAFLQCFLTSNALYLLIWDIRTVIQDIRQLGQCLCNLQSHAPSCSVVVALTFLDKLPGGAVEVVHQVKEELMKWEEESSQQNVYPHIAVVCAVSCESKEGIDELRQLICLSAVQMKDAFCLRQSVAGRPIPRSYLTLEERLRTDQKGQPYLTHSQFLELLEGIPNNDILSMDDLPKALQFLQECGTILHYTDELRGLNSLYFLDPSWLGQLLAKLVCSNNPTAYRVPLSSVEKALEEERIPRDLHEQILQLLEKFDIAVQVSDINLLIPYRLPLVPPAQELPTQRQTQVARLYCLRHIPEMLWSRLILRLLRAVSRFSQGHWFLGSLTPAQKPGSSNPSRGGSHRGLQLQDGRVKYWRQGLCVGTGQGECIVEAVTCRDDAGVERNGILITVQAAAEATKRVFPILGVIADEVDDVVKEFYNCFQEVNLGVVDVYALCPSCSGELVPGRGTVRLIGHPHFKLQNCAAAVLHDSEQDLVCPVKHNCLPASDLVPDLLLSELPKHFRLDPSKLRCDAKPLGDGATGTVVKGVYDKKNVAVKMFRYRHHHLHPEFQFQSTEDSRVSVESFLGGNFDSGSCSLKEVHSRDSDFSGDQLSGNSKTSEKAILGSLDSGHMQDDSDKEEEEDDDVDYGNVKSWCRRKPTTDREECDNLKVYKAFVELRKEVTMLSKLRHPCVVEFVGACISPRLMVAMELCPLGSLRSVLEKRVKDRPKVYPHQVHYVCYPLVFGKDLTYKIVYQVAKGLAYLHKHHIIYRDMKTENVLVVSLDETATINIKLSDYGISKFSTAQGLQGLVGTPGYIAPEIIQGLAYNEKVDIFSFAMVVYEVMCGHLPYHNCSNMNQITQAVVKDEKRPSLDEFCVVSHFPCMEWMMKRSWLAQARSRPSSDSLVSSMQHFHFLCQHDIVSSTAVFNEITCMAIAPDMTAEKQLLWMWEKGLDGERLCHIYNLTNARFHLQARFQQGETVTCAAKVGRFMWLGTEKAEIEMYGCGNVGSPRCQKTISLSAPPTHMLYLMKEPRGNSKTGTVFVGLKDGTLAIFCYRNPVSTQSSRRTPHLEALNWHLFKSISLGAEIGTNPQSAPEARMDITWSTIPGKGARLRPSKVYSGIPEVNPSQSSSAGEGSSGSVKAGKAISGMVVTKNGQELWVAMGCHLGVISLPSLQLDDYWAPAADLAAQCRRSVLCKSIGSIVSLGHSVWVSFYKSKIMFQINVETRKVTHILTLGQNTVCSKRRDEVTPPSYTEARVSASSLEDDSDEDDSEDDSDSDESTSSEASAHDREDRSSPYARSRQNEKSRTKSTTGDASTPQRVRYLNKPKVSVDRDRFTADHSYRESAGGETNLTAGETTPSSKKNLGTSPDVQNECIPPPIPPRRFGTIAEKQDTVDGSDSLSSFPPPPPPRRPSPAPGRCVVESEARLPENSPALPPRLPKKHLLATPPSPHGGDLGSTGGSVYHNLEFPEQKESKPQSSSADSPASKEHPAGIRRGRRYPGIPAGGPFSVPFIGRADMIGADAGNSSQERIHSENTSDSASSTLTTQKSLSLPCNSSLGHTPSVPLYVASLLVVKDTLWVGSSLGQIHILCGGERPFGYSSSHITTLPALWNSAPGAPTARISQPQGASPVYRMAAMEELVVTVSRPEGNDQQCHVLTWQAFSVEEFLTKTSYWQSVMAEERQLRSKDSLDTL